jgi:hypothetical protein
MIIRKFTPSILSIIVGTATLCLGFVDSAFCMQPSHAATAAPQLLANYIGGEHDLMILKRGANGAGWDTTNCEYRVKCEVPWGKDGKDWSVWLIYDNAKAGDYFGAITLHSDGTTVSMEKYVAPEKPTGHYVVQPTLRYHAEGYYYLTVDKIYWPAGPFVDTPLAKPATRDDGSKIILSTKGHQIIDDQGKPITLKGVARMSLEWNRQGQYLSPQEIKLMREKWNVNVLRIDLHQRFWFGSAPKTQTGSYKQIIDAMIYHALANQMAVILDLHWTEKFQHEPMANKESLRFWQEVAKEYKEFGTVMFELFNEPFTIPTETWLNGNNIYAGYQQLYDAVRSTGAQNICIINGLDWGYMLSFVNDNFKVRGENIVYGAHPYSDKGSDNWSPEYGGSFAHNFKGILGKHPIIFTEFGVNDSTRIHNQEYVSATYSRILDYANKYGINYTAFAWWVDPQAPATPTLISDWDGTPMKGGVLVHKDLHANYNSTSSTSNAVNATNTVNTANPIDFFQNPQILF